MQQGCNKDATRMQQGCNRDATRMQQGCNKDAHADGDALLRAPALMRVSLAPSRLCRLAGFRAGARATRPPPRFQILFSEIAGQGRAHWTTPKRVCRRNCRSRRHLGRSGVKQSQKCQGCLTSVRPRATHSSRSRSCRSWSVLPRKSRIRE